MVEIWSSFWNLWNTLNNLVQNSLMGSGIAIYYMKALTIMTKELPKNCKAVVFSHNAIERCL